MIKEDSKLLLDQLNCFFPGEYVEFNYGIPMIRSNARRSGLRMHSMMERIHSVGTLKPGIYDNSNNIDDLVTLEDKQLQAGIEIPDPFTGKTNKFNIYVDQEDASVIVYDPDTDRSLHVSILDLAILALNRGISEEFIVNAPGKKQLNESFNQIKKKGETNDE